MKNVTTKNTEIATLTGASNTLDFRNYLNTFEVFTLLKIIVILIEICDILVIKNESDLKKLF